MVFYLVDLMQYQHKIPFTVIGTDTSMFDRGVGNVTEVDLGLAERVDLLINFQGFLPPGVQYVYIVCFDYNQGVNVVKHRFSLPWINGDKGKGESEKVEGANMRREE